MYQDVVDEVVDNTAGVEANNIASQRYLVSVGFSAENEVADGNGFLVYSYGLDGGGMSG